MSASYTPDASPLDAQPSNESLDQTAFRLGNQSQSQIDRQQEGLANEFSGPTTPVAPARINTGPAFSPLQPTKPTAPQPNVYSNVGKPVRFNKQKSSPGITEYAKTLAMPGGYNALYGNANQYNQRYGKLAQFANNVRNGGSLAQNYLKVFHALPRPRDISPAAPTPAGQSLAALAANRLTLDGYTPPSAWKLPTALSQVTLPLDRNSLSDTNIAPREINANPTTATPNSPQGYPNLDNAERVANLTSNAMADQHAYIRNLVERHTDLMGTAAFENPALQSFTLGLNHFGPDWMRQGNLPVLEDEYSKLHPYWSTAAQAGGGLVGSIPSMMGAGGLGEMAEGAAALHGASDLASTAARLGTESAVFGGANAAPSLSRGQYGQAAQQFVTGAAMAPGIALGDLAARGVGGITGTIAGRAVNAATQASLNPSNPILGAAMGAVSHPVMERFPDVEEPPPPTPEEVNSLAENPKTAPLATAIQRSSSGQPIMPDGNLSPEDQQLLAHNGVQTPSELARFAVELQRSHIPEIRAYGDSLVAAAKKMSLKPGTLEEAQKAAESAAPGPQTVKEAVKRYRINTAARMRTIGQLLVESNDPVQKNIGRELLNYAQRGSSPPAAMQRKGIPKAHATTTTDPELAARMQAEGADVVHKTTGEYQINHKHGSSTPQSADQTPETPPDEVPPAKPEPPTPARDYAPSIEKRKNTIAENKIATNAPTREVSGLRKDAIAHVLNLAKKDGAIADDDFHEDVANGNIGVDRDALDEGSRKNARHLANDNASSNATAGMTASQKDAYNRRNIELAGRNKQDNIDKAIEYASKSPDPIDQLMAAYARGDAATRKVKIDVNKLEGGDKLTINGHPYVANIDADGYVTLEDHPSVHAVNMVNDGVIPVDKGSLVKSKGFNPDDDFTAGLPTDEPPSQGEGSQRGLAGIREDSNQPATQKSMFGDASVDKPEKDGRRPGETAEDYKIRKKFEDNTPGKMFDQAKPASLSDMAKSQNLAPDDDEYSKNMNDAVAAANKQFPDSLPPDSEIAKIAGAHNIDESELKHELISRAASDVESQVPPGNPGGKPGTGGPGAMGQKLVRATIKIPAVISKVFESAKNEIQRLKPLYRSLRERYAGLESRFGAHVSEPFIDNHAIPEITSNHVDNWFKEAFGKSADADKNASEFLILNAQARIPDHPDSNIPQLTREDITRIENEPWYPRAVSAWNKWIGDPVNKLRKANGQGLTAVPNNRVFIGFAQDFEKTTRLNLASDARTPFQGLNGDEMKTDPKAVAASMLRSYLKSANSKAMDAAIIHESVKVPDPEPADLMAAGKASIKSSLREANATADLLKLLRTGNGGVTKIIAKAAADEANPFVVRVAKMAIKQGMNKGNEAFTYLTSRKMAFEKQASDALSLLSNMRDAAKDGQKNGLDDDEIVKNMRAVIAKAPSVEIASDFAKRINGIEKVPPEVNGEKGARWIARTVDGKNVEEPVEKMAIGDDKYFTPSRLARAFKERDISRKGESEQERSSVSRMAIQMGILGAANPHIARFASLARSINLEGIDDSGVHAAASNIPVAGGLFSLDKFKPGTTVGDSLEEATHRLGAGTGSDYGIKGGIGHRMIRTEDQALRNGLLHTYLLSKAGDRYTDIMKSVQSHNLSPSESADKIMGILSPSDRSDLRRRLNDTVGHANRQIRSNVLNLAQNIFPFITSNASLFTAGAKMLLPFNMPEALDYLRRGDYQGALKTQTVHLARSVAGGALAVTAWNAAQGYNSLNSNDPLAIHFGKDTLDIDPLAYRALRFTGLIGKYHTLNDLLHLEISKAIPDIVANFGNNNLTTAQYLLHPVAQLVVAGIKSAIQSKESGQAFKHTFLQTMLDNIPVVGSAAQSHQYGATLPQAALSSAIYMLTGAQFHSTGDDASAIATQNANTADKANALSATAIDYQLTDALRAAAGNPSALKDAQNAVDQAIKSKQITPAMGVSILKNGSLTKEGAAVNRQTSGFLESWKNANPSEKTEIRDRVSKVLNEGKMPYGRAEELSKTIGVPMPPGYQQKQAFDKAETAINLAMATKGLTPEQKKIAWKAVRDGNHAVTNRMGIKWIQVAQYRQYKGEYHPYLLAREHAAKQALFAAGAQK